VSENWHYAVVVGVDTGLVHLAHALGKPSVMIFRATSRHHCGIAGTPHSLSLGELGAIPTVEQVHAAARQVCPEIDAQVQFDE
jgi:heptosyltransferase I